MGGRNKHELRGSDLRWKTWRDGGVKSTLASTIQKREILAITSNKYFDFLFRCEMPAK